MNKLKRCPFCGGKVSMMNMLTPLTMFYCMNTIECGAIVSFDNDKCNLETGNTEKIRCWNRRDVKGR